MRNIRLAELLERVTPRLPLGTVTDGTPSPTSCGVTHLALCRRTTGLIK